jgi:signal transduction histidine kinase
VQPFLERIVTHLERVEKGTIRSTFEPEVVTDADALEDERLTLDDWQSAPRYCEHLLLARAASLTPAGVTLLRLRGVDRLRWLLAMETSLATSSLDPWCLDLESARRLFAALRSPWLLVDDELPANRPAIARWSELGALRLSMGETSPATLELTAVGHSIFGELAGDDPTPFRSVARALLDDERDRVLTSIGGNDPSGDRATTATVRHARMVAHEVRNALLPVQYALEKIFSSPVAAAEDLVEPRRRVEEGLARLHRFVDDSLRLTPIADEEVTSFSVMDALEEARRRCDPPPGGGVLIEAWPGSADPRCRGHRGRFVLALLNLLRNAVQVGGPSVRVEIGVDARTTGRVLLSVRDDGPGLSEAQRASIFENGISYREGGSGHGLSYVREVVEEEMGGDVRAISTADRRGACFELELPTAEDET